MLRRACLALLLVGLAACARSDPGAQLLPTRAVSVPAPSVRPGAAAGTIAPCGVRAPAKPAAVAGGAVNRIALLSPEGNVRVLNPSDGSLIDITNDADDGTVSGTLLQYRFPTFSRDGTQLAFTGISVLSGTFNPSQTLQVAPVAKLPTRTSLYSTDQQNIPYLDWSPDSRHIALLSIDAAGGEILVVPSTGGVANRFDRGSTVYWDWQPATRNMVAHLSGSMALNPGAYLAQGEATSAKAVKLPSQPGNFQSPQFSPDGKQLAFVRAFGGANELVIADGAGSIECIVAGIAKGAYFAWSPDGRRMAFIDTVSPVFEPAPIRVYDLVSGSVTTPTNDTAAFFWSNDGTLLTVAIDERADVFDVSGGRVITQLLPSPAPVLVFELVNPATGSRTPLGQVLPTREFVQLLGFFDQYSRAVTPWSPDGMSVVFTGASPAGREPFALVATFSAGGVRLASPVAATLAFWSPR